MHSTAVVLGAHAAGQPPLPEALMLGNVLVASMLGLGSAANLLEEPRLGDIARRIQAELKSKPPAASDT